MEKVTHLFDKFIKDLYFPLLLNKNLVLFPMKIHTKMFTLTD